MSDAESFLDSQIGLVFGAPGEWMQLAITGRDAGTVYGDCAVRVLTDQPATAEIGVTLAPTSQGKGIATEAPPQPGPVLLVRPAGEAPAYRGPSLVTVTTGTAFSNGWL